MRYFIYIAILSTLVGCGDDNRCLKSLGDETRIEKELSAVFNKIYVEDRIKVNLIQDSTQVGTLVLKGPENLLSSVGTEVRDGQLRLTNDNTCNFLRSFEYTLTVDLYIHDLNELQIESIAEVSCRDSVYIEKLEVIHNALSDIDLLLKGTEVFVRSRNSASTTLRGKVKTMKGSIEEVSDLDAKDLLCEEVLLDNHSPLDCKINASKGYYLNLYNAGNIEQYGDATVYAIVNEQTGSGVVIQK